MSGFLTNLAARARGTVPRLAPRKPAPYEMQADRGVTPDGGGEVALEVPVPPVPRPQVAAPTVPVVPDAPGRPVTPLAGSPTPTAAPVSAPASAPVTKATPAPATPARRMSGVTPSSAPASVAPSVTPAAAVPPAAKPVAPTASVPREAKSPVSVPVAPKGEAIKPGAAQEVPAVTDVPVRPTANVPPVVERPDPLPVEGAAAPDRTLDPAAPAVLETDLTLPQEAPIAPAPEAAPPLLTTEIVEMTVERPGAPAAGKPAKAAQSQPAEPPQVEVHIGTIEVVAEAPAAPAQAPAAAPPRGLSLDDYLDGTGGR